MTIDVAIIGGGISGLSAAYDLRQRGYKVCVLERQQTVGGNAISQRIDGFLMEHGPSTLNAATPAAATLAAELGLASQRVELGDGVRKRYLRHGERLYGISVHPAGFLMSNYLSLRGRLSLMGEVLRPPAQIAQNETVHDFAARRFGKEFAQKVMGPLAAGMFAGDARSLAMNATFPKLRQMEREFGSITRGIMNARRGREPGKRLFSFAGGIGALPRALHARLAGAVETGVAVTSISRGSSRLKIEMRRAATGCERGTLSARAVILAVQPHVAMQLIADLDERASSVLATVDAPPMSVVFLAYARGQVAHPLDSLGFLSTQKSGGVIAGAQFCSTMFAGRAPEGYVSIAAYVGGTQNREAGRMARADLVPLVHAQLSGLLQISGEPIVSSCRQWARSLPQYEIGHEQKVGVLGTLHERQPGLFLTGNYLSGVSVGNCITQARHIAGGVARHLAHDAALSDRKVSANLSL